MMDFDNILSIASQNQGVSSVQQKRYSLQTGPPKKDPKSKGVSSAAIQALLKKQQSDIKTKEIQMKKQKDELLAKRVELKSDRKARAMASRTKDNFRGYNGIPMVEAPKKRKSKFDMQEERGMNSEQFRNRIIDPEDDEDNYEYEQTDSESEQETLQNTYNGSSSSSSSSKSLKKTSTLAKSTPLNFADLLKLAEKKQHEPVEVKSKVVKKEERLRTADEIRELELERKAKRHDKDVKGERVRDGMSQCRSSSTKGTLEKDLKNGNIQKSRTEKQSHPQLKNDKGKFSSKSSVNDRDKTKSSHKAPSNKLSKSEPTSSQVSAKQMGTELSSSHKSSDLAAKKDNLFLQGRFISTPRSGPSSSSSTGQKPQPPRPQGVLPKQGTSSGAQRRGEPQRPVTNATVKSNGSTSLTKPGFNNKRNQPQARPGGIPQMKSDVRPGASGVRSQGVGPGRPGIGAPNSGQGAGSYGAGPGAPRCTVVSETISSKNVGGTKGGVPPRPGSAPRPGMQQRPGMPPRPGMLQRPGMPPSPGMQQRPGMPPSPGMQQRPGMPPRPGMQQRPGMPPKPGMQQRPGMPPSPGMQQRPGMPPRPGMPSRPGMPINRPPGPMLPPITSAYKRKYEDEEDEYDSEMDDFIDDGDDEQEEISKHIKEIFGYDRNRYKEESDYALRFMESSWKDMQKEEAKSLRMAVQEDLEEEKREEEEMKKSAKRQKRN